MVQKRTLMDVRQVTSTTLMCQNWGLSPPPWLDNPSELRPNFSGFEIVLRHPTLGRTPLDE